MPKSGICKTINLVKLGYIRTQGTNVLVYTLVNLIYRGGEVPVVLYNIFKMSCPDFVSFRQSSFRLGNEVNYVFLTMLRSTLISSNFKDFVWVKITLLGTLNYTIYNILVMVMCVCVIMESVWSNE